MSRVLNLNNSENIIADSIFLIRGDDLIDINDLFLTKSEGNDIVGIAPDTLDTLQEIANAIGNDSDFINTINTQLNLKRNIADSYDKTHIDNLISNYYTKSEINSSLALKLDASIINSYYDKTYVDNLISGYYTKTEANTLLNLKANSSDVYTTTQTDTLLALKANQSTTYTKSEVDTSLNLKANQSTTYTKAETDTLLNSKANQATTYTKSEVDTALLTKVDLTTYNTEKVLKADIANVYYKSVLYTKTEVNTLLGNKFNSSDISNYYTKTEIDTTFGLYYNKSYIDTLISNYYNKTYIDTTVAGINSDINLKLNASAINNYYTKTEVDTQFSNLIDSAPDALNTLKELADALNNDANYATTIQNQLATKRNISDSYNKTEVDALVNAPQNIVYTSSLWFQDVNSSGIDTLSIKGGDYITIIDALNNSLMDLDTTEIQIHPPLRCLSTATFDSNITAPNIYTRTETNTLLTGKQNTLVDRGGTGAVLIDLGTDNKVSRMFGGNGINVSRYLNLADSNDPNNFNIKIDGSTLETAINTNTASINTLSSSKLNVSNPIVTGSLIIQGADFKLFASGRANGNTHNGRALVHDNGDILSINYAGDYTGGVKINGACQFTGNLTVPNIYNKTETNNLLSSKLDTSTFNTQIALKANSSDVYTITQTDNLLSNKADSSSITSIQSDVTDLQNKIVYECQKLVGPPGFLGLRPTYVEFGGSPTYAMFSVPITVSNMYNKTEVDNLVANAGSDRIEESSTLTKVIGGTGGVQLRDGDASNTLLLEANSIGTSVLGDLTVTGKITSSVVACNFYPTSNLTLLDTVQNVPYSTARYNNGGFSLSNGEITIPMAGVYHFQYHLTTDVSSGFSRSTAIAYAQLNSASIPKSHIYTYNRDQNSGENTAHFSSVLSLNANDVIRVKNKRNSGTDTLICTQSSGITLIRL